MSEVLAYRLVKRKWQETAFDGEGARLYGGRWNSKGNACVYVAGSESLALLEIMVHLEEYRLLAHYALLEISLDETSILRLSPQHWPDDWRDEPAPYSTAEIGDGWLSRQASLALAVPSVIVPREWNYLLNPAHPDFISVTREAKALDFLPDPRL
ncbi:MAG: RES domain-containing protein [Halomonas sp.]|nr:RES family NAD+ phosphorylase [Halomonas sp.]TVM05650.1 MAG: RES domain-containing protein [Halomonas sp.]